MPSDLSCCAHSALRPLAFVLLASVLALAGSSDALADPIDSELHVGSVHVSSKTTLPDGRIEVVITAEVTNTHGATYEEVIAIAPQLPDAAEVVDGSLSFDVVGPYGVVPSTDTATFIVPTNGVRPLGRDLRVSESWTVHGEEEPTIAANVLFLDEETGLAYKRTEIETDLTWRVFTSTTALLDQVGAGTVLASNATVYDGTLVDMPWRIDQKDIRGDEVWLSTTQAGLTDLYSQLSLDAEFSYLADDSTVGPVDSQAVDDFDLLTDGCDNAWLPCEYKGLHIRFNDEEVYPGVTLNGSLVLGNINGNFKLVIRDSIPTITAQATITESMALELWAEVEEEFEVEERTLFNVSLPIITIPAGPITLTVSISVEMQVGADGIVTAEMHSSAIQSGVVTMRVGGGEPPSIETDIEPISFSPPQLTDNTEADANAFARFTAKLLIGDETGLASTGPAFTTELNTNLHVDPLEDPWWTLQGTLNNSARLELNLLGIQIDLVEEAFDPIDLWQESANDALLGHRVAMGVAGSAGAVDTSGNHLRWSKVYREDGVVGPDGNDVLPTSDGGYLISGFGDKGFLVKVDREGALEWARTLLRDPIAVFETNVGYWVVGDRNHTSTVFVANVSRDGDLLSIADQSLTPSPMYITSIAMLDGDSSTPSFVFVGEHSIRINEALVARLDHLGDVQWAKTFPSTSGSIRATDVVVAQDGNLIIGAYGQLQMSAPDAGLYNSAVLKVDPNGDLLWARMVGIHGRGDQIVRLIEGWNGDILYTGWAYRGLFDAHESAFRVGQITSEGDPGWESTITADIWWETDKHGWVQPSDFTGAQYPLYTTYDTANAITPTNGGGYLVAGFGGLNSDSAAWLARIDGSGNPLWMDFWNGLKNDTINSVVDIGTGFIALGGSRSFSPLGVGGDMGMWLTALPYDGAMNFRHDTQVIEARRVKPHVDRISGLDHSTEPLTIVPVDLTPTPTTIVDGWAEPVLDVTELVR